MDKKIRNKKDKAISLDKRKLENLYNVTSVSLMAVFVGGFLIIFLGIGGLKEELLVTQNNQVVLSDNVYAAWVALHNIQQQFNITVSYKEYFCVEPYMSTEMNVILSEVLDVKGDRWVKDYSNVKLYYVWFKEQRYQHQKIGGNISIRDVEVASYVTPVYGMTCFIVHDGAVYKFGGSLCEAKCSDNMVKVGI